jgi:hypothetical protein
MGDPARGGGTPGTKQLGARGEWPGFPRSRRPSRGIRSKPAPRRAAREEGPSDRRGGPRRGRGRPRIPRAGRPERSGSGARGVGLPRSPRRGTRGTIRLQHSPGTPVSAARARGSHDNRRSGRGSTPPRSRSRRGVSLRDRARRSGRARGADPGIPRLPRSARGARERRSRRDRWRTRGGPGASRPRGGARPRSRPQVRRGTASRCSPAPPRASRARGCLQPGGGSPPRRASRLLRGSAVGARSGEACEPISEGEGSEGVRLGRPPPEALGAPGAPGPRMVPALPRRRRVGWVSEEGGVASRVGGDSIPRAERLRRL